MRVPCRLRATVTALALFCTAGAAAAPGIARGKPQERILFIGNSLTYSHDLPRMVQDASTHDTDIDVTCESVAFPNFSLEDHWSDGRAVRKLQSARWTVVVLQQGPSASVDGRRLLREYTRRFSEIARRQGSRVALYAVWPSRARLGDIDAAIESYRLAAADAGASLVPVSVAWRDLLHNDPTFPLYDRDGLHPSPIATYLATLMFREWLTGISSTGFTSRWAPARRLSLSVTQAEPLEQAAHRAVGAFPFKRAMRP